MGDARLIEFLDGRGSREAEEPGGFPTLPLLLSHRDDGFHTNTVGGVKSRGVGLGVEEIIWLDRDLK